MTFHRGDDPPLPVPCPCLVIEAGVEAANMIRRAANGAAAQTGDMILNNHVRLEPNGVAVAFGFEERIAIR